MAATARYPRGVVRAIAFGWGLQFAFLSPALALLLVSLFGASNGAVSLVLLIYNAACLLTSFVIPRWADRRGDYVRPMVGCAGFTVGLSLVLAFAHQLPIAVTGLVLLGAPAAVGTPLLFGYVRHSGAPPRDVVRTRAVFSMAWVAGPPIASAVISGAGGHALVWAIGAVGLANVSATGYLLSRRTGSQPSAASPGGVRVRVPRKFLVLMVAAFALLQASNSASVAVTTLFVKQNLGLDPMWGGVALGVAAGLEVPVLFLLGRPRRIGDFVLLMLAGGAGVVYFVVMALARNGITVVAIEVMNACFYGVVAGVGLTLFQRVIAGPGAAAGLLSNAQRIGAMLAGPLIAIGSINGAGLRAVFSSGAVVTAGGVLLMWLVGRHSPAGAASGPEALAVDPDVSQNWLS